MAKKLSLYEQVIATLEGTDFEKVKTSGSDTRFFHNTGEKMEKWVHSADELRYYEEVFVAKKGQHLTAQVYGRFSGQESATHYTFQEFLDCHGVEDDNG